MSLDLLLLLWVLFAAASYLMLDRDLWNILMGFILFSNAVNLLLLASSKSPPEAALPFAEEGGAVPLQDPLPHALILTAIVIGFGLTAYFASMIHHLLQKK